MNFFYKKEYGLRMGLIGKIEEYVVQIAVIQTVFAEMNPVPGFCERKQASHSGL